MFESPIQRSAELIERLEAVKTAYDDDKLHELHRSKQVYVSELKAWFDSTRAMISAVFGKDSVELKEWNNRKEYLSRIDRYDAARDTFYPSESYIANISSLQRLLIEFEETWRARQQRSRFSSYKDQVGNDSSPSKLPQELGAGDNGGGQGKTIQIILALITAITAIVVAYFQFGRSPDKPEGDKEERQFIGRVIDAVSEKRIRGAKVSLEAQGVPPILYTDSEGIFSFPLENVGRSIRITVEAAGYRLYDRRIDPRTASGIEDVRLEPVSTENVQRTGESRVAGSLELKPTGPVGANLEFVASNESEPFAIKGSFRGDASVTGREIRVQVKEANLSFPELAPDGGDRYVEYVSAGVACDSGGAWDIVSRSNVLPVRKVFRVGEREELESFSLTIPRSSARDIVGCWLVFNVAIKNGPTDTDLGFSHAHARESRF